jgi:hypothetical protein
MKTVLYNIETQTTIGDFRIGHYIVDGVRPMLEPNIIELIVDDYDPMPHVEFYQYAISEWSADIKNRVWKKTWNVVDRDDISEEEGVYMVKNSFENHISEGLTVDDYVLKFSEIDRSAFSQLLVMLNESEKIGLLPQYESFIDFYGKSHILPVNELRSLLIKAAHQYKILWDKRNQLIHIMNQAEKHTRSQIDLSFK